MLITKFSGHNDIWLYDELQLKIENLRNLVPMSYKINGWINGLLYQPTSEVSGLLPIPASICMVVGLQPMISDPTSKILHRYLSNRQGTLFAVIGVHTIDEKKLFSCLMKEDPSFNRNKQEPDWKAAVQVWNISSLNIYLLKSNEHRPRLKETNDKK